MLHLNADLNRGAIRLARLQHGRVASSRDERRNILLADFLDQLRDSLQFAGLVPIERSARWFAIVGNEGQRRKWQLVSAVSSRARGLVRRAPHAAFA